MKKQLLTVAIAIASFLTAKESSAQVQFGVRGGVNQTTFSEDIFESRTGFNAGIVAYSNLEKPLFFQSGLLFSQKGMKVDGFSFEDDDISVEFEGKVQSIYNYLEVPLNVGYSLPVGNFIKVAPYAGPYVSYAVSGNSKFDGNKANLFDDSDLGEKPKRFDFGANVGAGVHFGNKIIVNGQYNYGLSKVIGDFKHRGVSFGLTYLF